MNRVLKTTAEVYYQDKTVEIQWSRNSMRNVVPTWIDPDYAVIDAMSLEEFAAFCKARCQFHRQHWPTSTYCSIRQKTPAERAQEKAESDAFEKAVNAGPAAIDAYFAAKAAK